MHERLTYDHEGGGHPRGHETRTLSAVSWLHWKGKATASACPVYHPGNKATLYERIASVRSRMLKAAEPTGTPAKPQETVVSTDTPPKTPGE
jgi:hypothetical protein